MNKAKQDYERLVKATPELGLSHHGLRAVDWGTYDQRIKASRQGRRSPYDLLNDPKGRQYLEEKAMKFHQKVHNILGIYGNLVSSFKPLHAKYLCHRFSATSVLDFSAGWGGRMLGSVSHGCRYIGIDTNHDLKDGYDRLIRLTRGNVTMMWQPAETVDFTQLDYDFILSSPPFGNLEKYPHQLEYRDWLREFLLPVVGRAFSSLKIGGWMSLCLPENLARAISHEIGEHSQTVPLPIRSRRKGRITTDEIVYCWQRLNRIQASHAPLT